jgi:hypothetical protein
LKTEGKKGKRNDKIKENRRRKGGRNKLNGSKGNI